MARPEPSFLRVVATPLLLMAAGFLWAGWPGFAAGLALGLLWVAWAVRPPRR